MELQDLAPEMRQRLREYFHETKHLQVAMANRKLLAKMSPALAGEVAVTLTLTLTLTPAASYSPR